MSDGSRLMRRAWHPGWWLFCGGLFCAILAGIRIAVPYLRVTALRSELAELDGSVKTDQGGPEWLRRIVGDDAMIGFDIVREVHASGDRADDEWLLRLREFPELRRADLFGSNITDAGLAVLKSIPSIRSISAGYTNVTDAGLVHAGQMPQLDYLGVRGDAVTDAGLAHLAGLTNLTGLYLGETGITDAGLVHLQGMTKLQSLWLYDTAVTEAGVQKMADFPALRRLYISPNQLSADGLDELQRSHPELTVTIQTIEHRDDSVLRMKLKRYDSISGHR